MHGTITLSADARLDQLATEIRNAHAQVELHARKSIEAMLLAGEKLAEAQALMKHGEWLPWLRDVCKIPRRSASRYMKLAENRAILDREIQMGHVAQMSVRVAEALVAEVELQQHRDKMRALGAGLPDSSDRYQLFHADMAEARIAPGSVDAIITDPPYCSEDVPLFSVLAERAAAWLRPGGSLLTMANNASLGEIIQRLEQGGLRYRWTFADQHAGPTNHIHQPKIFAAWKPIVWCTNGEYLGTRWKRDVIKGGGRCKQHHKWGQSESEFAQLIEYFTEPGDMVLDPFLGGGTTGAAALKLGRKFVGCEIDAKAFQLCKARLAEIPPFSEIQRNCANWRKIQKPPKYQQFRNPIAKARLAELANKGGDHATTDQ
jgi:16S rRNA G966 N2-methylase RsmD